MQDGNTKHMLVSERALSVEGGYQETNIALHLDTHTHTTQIHTKGFVKTYLNREMWDMSFIFASVLLPPQQDFSSN